MTRLPSRLRRLDDALADLADDGDAMLLSELDGYLTGIALAAEPIAADEWLPPIWRGDGDAVPFEDAADRRWFVERVTAHRDGIARDLARGRPQPLFDIDARTGEVLWDAWIEGLQAAIALRPGGWVPPAGDDGDLGDAIAGLALLAQIAAEESELTSAEINDVSDAAPGLIPHHLVRLHAWRQRSGAPVGTPTPVPARIGRNDPCPCGSGLKHKRCCGAP